MAAEDTPAAAPLAFAVQVPFAELLGFELVRFEEGYSEIAMEVRPELCNSWAVAHGGTLMALLDVSMAHATRSPPRPGEPAPSHGVVTIEMKTTFMRPANGRIIGRGRLLHRTRSFSFCEADVVDAQGQRLAHATGTFKNRRPTEPTAGSPP